MATAAQRCPETDAAGPFAVAAQELRAHGLAPIPLGGDDGKKPLISNFTKWKRLPSTDTLLKWAEKYPFENVGIVTELSGVTIVDVDDPALLDSMIERFGDTPLKTTTPSGGFHLWYKANGEQSRTRLDGLKVDIKASGGIVVVPPSSRPTGPYAGEAYRFLTGSWSELSQLPTIKQSGLVIPIADSATRVPVGQRREALRSFALRHGPNCKDKAALREAVLKFVDDECEDREGIKTHPVSDREIDSVVDWVWQLEEDDENWVGKQGRVILTPYEMDTLVPYPDALSLYVTFLRNHSTRIEPFAVSSKKMAEHNVIPSWGSRRYGSARKVLEKLELLELVYQGGNGPSDPSLFRLIKKGCSKCTQYK